MNEGQLDIIEIRIIRDVGRCKFHGRFWQHSDSKMMDRQDTETVRSTLFSSFNFSARGNLTIRRRTELFFPGHWRMLPDTEISRRKTETSGIVSRSETLPKMQSTTIRDAARFGKETREKNERSSATLSLLPLPSWNCEVLDGKDKVTNFFLIIQLFFNEKKLEPLFPFSPVVPKIWMPFWTSTRIYWQIQRVKRSRSRRATLCRRDCTGYRLVTDQRTLIIIRGKGSRILIDVNAGSSRIRCTRSWRIYCTRVRTTISVTNIRDRWRIVTRRRAITWGTTTIR